MSVIYLQHFIHGTKVATSEMEAKYDEASGWTRYTPGTPADEAADPVNQLGMKRKYTRRAPQESTTEDR